MFDKIKTDEALLKAIDKAIRAPQSRDDSERQRVSFVFSAVKGDGNVTEDRIKQVLERLI